MATLKQFTTQSARPLPVIILADTSGSMGVDGKIEALNLALKDMLVTFKGKSRLRAEIQVAIITFGGSANVFQPLTPAKIYELAQNNSQYFSVFPQNQIQIMRPLPIELKMQLDILMQQYCNEDTQNLFKQKMVNFAQMQNLCGCELPNIQFYPNKNGINMKCWNCNFGF